MGNEWTTITLVVYFLSFLFYFLKGNDYLMLFFFKLTFDLYF